MDSQQAFDMVRRYRGQIEELERALTAERKSHAVTEALLSVAEARINKMVKEREQGDE